MNRGQLAILAMFGAAIGLAVVAVWVRFDQGNQALEFWGTESAQLIRHASKTELLWLDAQDEPPTMEIVEHLLIDGHEVAVIRRQDISQVRGLVHARHALITDASFHWDEPRGDCQPQWSYVLRFSDGNRTALVAIDTACGRVRLVGEDREASIAPAIDALQEFFQQLEELADKGTRDSGAAAD